MFKVDADTLNAMVNAMGALTLCLAKQLSVEQQKALQDDLAALSRSRIAAGDTKCGTLLLDLASAVERARS